MKAENRKICAVLALLLSIMLIWAAPQVSDGEPPPARIIFIQIDSMHPDYIDLNSTATGPGGQGDWLMPKVREFVAGSAHWPNAKAHFPQVTDVNVLNILSSGNSGTTGVLGVVRQPEFWGLWGLSRREIHLGKARYPDGGRVKTIFDIMKEQTPNLFKEPILDLIRDVDLAFGRLIDGLEQGGYLKDAAVILLSDHNMENYL